MPDMEVRRGYSAVKDPENREPQFTGYALRIERKTSITDVLAVLAEQGVHPDNAMLGEGTWVRFDRWETLDEADERWQQHMRAKIAKIDRERAEYERLRAIYGEDD